MGIFDLFKRKRKPGLEDRVRRWAEAQIAKGVPRQTVADDLYAKSDELIGDEEAFVREWRAHLQGKGPKPTGNDEALVYSRIANRIYVQMFGRNVKGRELENEGNIARAVELYEANVADRFEGADPYDRLRIIYTRQQRYRDAIRVCEAYIALPERDQGQDKGRFRRHLEELEARVASQEADAGRGG